MLGWYDKIGRALVRIARKHQINKLAMRLGKQSPISTKSLQGQLDKANSRNVKRANFAPTWGGSSMTLNGRW